MADARVKNVEDQNAAIRAENEALRLSLEATSNLKPSRSGEIRTSEGRHKD